MRWKKRDDELENKLDRFASPKRNTRYEEEYQEYEKWRKSMKSFRLYWDHQPPTEEKRLPILSMILIFGLLFYVPYELSMTETVIRIVLVFLLIIFSPERPRRPDRPTESAKYRGEKKEKVNEKV